MILTAVRSSVHLHMSGLAREDDDRWLARNDFFVHPGRALSAISRSIHAFFIVGNMNAIRKNPVYNQFLHYAVQRTPIVTDAYLELLDQPPRRIFNGTVLGMVNDATWTLEAPLANINARLLRDAKSRLAYFLRRLAHCSLNVVKATESTYVWAVS